MKNEELGIRNEKLGRGSSADQTWVEGGSSVGRALVERTSNADRARVERGSSVGSRESDVEAMIGRVLAADGKVPDRLSFKRRAKVLGTEFQPKLSTVRRLFLLMTRHYIASSIGAAAAVAIAFLGMLTIDVTMGPKSPASVCIIECEDMGMEDITAIPALMLDVAWDDPPALMPVVSGSLTRDFIEPSSYSYEMGNKSSGMSLGALSGEGSGYSGGFRMDSMESGDGGKQRQLDEVTASPPPPLSAPLSPRLAAEVSSPQVPGAPVSRPASLRSLGRVSDRGDVDFDDEIQIVFDAPRAASSMSAPVAMSAAKSPPPVADAKKKERNNEPMLAGRAVGSSNGSRRESSSKADAGQRELLESDGGERSQLSTAVGGSRVQSTASDSLRESSIAVDALLADVELFDLFDGSRAPSIAVDYFFVDADLSEADSFDPFQPPVSGFQHIAVNPFIATATQPLSTFAIGADSASYSMTRQSLYNGAMPEPSVVRVEEFVNAFD